MKAPKLRALEKNVLKYRALQMIMILHAHETLKRRLINSIRTTDRIFKHTPERLPPGCKKPYEKALQILIDHGILSEIESKHLLEYANFRNTIGHDVHKLLQYITGSDSTNDMTCLYDYYALERLQRYRKKISDGMMRGFVNEIGFAELIFEQAELTYKEELERLDRKIRRQIHARIKARNA